MALESTPVRATERLTTTVRGLFAVGGNAQLFSIHAMARHAAFRQCQSSRIRDAKSPDGTGDQVVGESIGSPFGGTQMGAEGCLG